MAGPRKCFLVTGTPGVGKTTLIMRVFESLRTSNPMLKIQGFYTREIRQASERVGFEVVSLDGRKAPLASTTISTWPTVGKYKVDVASFESLALPELQVAALDFQSSCVQKCPLPVFVWFMEQTAAAAYEMAAIKPGDCTYLVRDETDLFIIDEVGKMELYSSLFFPAVLKVLESNAPVLASIPVAKFGRDIPEVARLRNHPGASIFTLSHGNRDAVKEQIYTLLLDSLDKN